MWSGWRLFTKQPWSCVASMQRDSGGGSTNVDNKRGLLTTGEGGGTGPAAVYLPLAVLAQDGGRPPPYRGHGEPGIRACACRPATGPPPGRRPPPPGRG